MTTNLIYRAAREPSVADAYRTLAKALGTGAEHLQLDSRAWKHANITRRCDMLASFLVAECAAIAVRAERPVEFVNLGGTND